jgi:Domain of unknown function (DUF4129)
MKTTKLLLALLLAAAAWTCLPAQSEAVETPPSPPKSEKELEWEREWGDKTPEADPPVAKAPTQKTRAFSDSRLKAYRDNPDYRYLREHAAPPKREYDDYDDNNYSSRRPPIEINGPRGDFSGLGQVLIWILIIAAVGLVLYQLVQVKFGKLWKKKSDEAKVSTPPGGDDIEDIRNVEFDDAVQKAIHEKRYRVAVRLLYLRSLRQLQDRAMINWRREKTNRDYLYELSDPQLRPLFSDLTFVFEYIWYGEFPVNATHFETAHAGFLQFDQALRQRDAK